MDDFFIGLEPEMSDRDEEEPRYAEDAHLEADYEDRQNGGTDVDEDEDDEDDWVEPDPDVEFRKQVFNEVMERHPDMAFTGSSVQDYIYNDGELESASIDDPMRGEY